LEWWGFLLVLLACFPDFLRGIVFLHFGMPLLWLFKESCFHAMSRHILTMPVNKHFDSSAKRAPIELWRIKVPQKNIMKQLGMSKATLMRVLAVDSTAKNMVECKREITELWTLWINDRTYLLWLEASMPGRLAQVVERGGWTTYYKPVCALV